MAGVCELCGNVGIEKLLLSCHDCKGATHQYCLPKIIYDASVLKVWWCNECQPRHGKVTYKKSLYEVPNQKQPSHAHSGSGVSQACTQGVESTREAAISGNHKNKSCMSKSTSRRKRHSSRCDVETQRDINGNVTGNLMFEKSKKKVRFQLDNNVSDDLRSQNMAVNVPQPSALQKDDVDRVMLSSASMDVVPKENNYLPSEHVKIESPKNSCAALVLTGGNESDASMPPGRAYSSSFPETTSNVIIVLEDSDSDVELLGAVQSCVKDNPRKRKQPILLDSDNEEAAEVQPEDFNHQSLEHGGSMSNQKIGTEDCEEEAVLTGDTNGQNLENGRPVKNQKRVEDVKLDVSIPESSEITWPAKKLRCTEVNEDEEVIIGTRKCTPNNISKLASETVVAEDHPQSRVPFDSESPNQQCCIYSQPIDEPIWSGRFKINNELYVMLAGHLSSKACEMVWKLSTSMQPEIEIIKIPRLEAWPDSWQTSGPTDDNIALYFFPPSMRKNEKFDSLVEETIEGDSVLKAVVGIAELLIFPSTILPELYHVCQGKHYLWGVFRRRKDKCHKDILVEEQDGSASASEEGDIREHRSMDHQCEVQCESSDSETSVVKHVVHVAAQEEAMKADMREGLCSPGGNSSSAKPNPPKDKQNLTKPSGDSGPAATTPKPIDSAHREPAPPGGNSSSAKPNPPKDKQDLTKPSGDSGPAATTPKPIDSAHREPAPTSTKLFGLVTARTPRAQQLIQEMIKEGALLFSVPEERTTTGSTVINHTRVPPHLTPDSKEDPPTEEHCRSIDFVSMDPDDPCEASEACLELFPVRQDHIGWTPKGAVAEDVDLDLSLRVHPRASPPLL